MLPYFYTLRDKFLTHEQGRFFLWSPVCVGLGILFYFQLRTEPSLIFISLAACLTLLSAALYVKYRHALALGRLILAGCFWAGCGFLAATLQTYRLDPAMLTKPLPPLTLEGQVRKVSLRGLKEHGDAQGVTLTLDHLNFQASPQISLPPRYPKAVRLVCVKGGTHVQRGDIVRCKVKLLPLPAPVWPRGYHFRRQLFFEGIGASGFTLTPPEVIQPPLQLSYLDQIHHLRDTLTQRIYQHLPKPFSSIGAALMTGETGELPSSVRQSFADAGLAHLLAISGLHFSIVVGLLFLLIQGGLALCPPVALRAPLHKIAALLTLGGSAFYLVLSGAHVPSQRAFLMTAGVLLALILDRGTLSLRLVAIAALILLLGQPALLLGASFQLSFAAVIALIALYELWRERLRRPYQKTPFWRWPFYWLGVSLLSTLVATFATTPYSLVFFHKMSLQGILANLIAVPLTTFCVMPLGVLVCFSFLWGGSTLLIHLWSIVLQKLWAIAAFFSHLPGAFVAVPVGAPDGLFWVTFGGLWLCLWKSRLRWAGLPLLCIGWIRLFTPSPPHILISDDAQLMAIFERSTQTLWVNTQRRGAFIRENWMALTGATHEKLFPSQPSTKHWRITPEKLTYYFQENAQNSPLGVLLTKKSPVQSLPPFVSLVISPESLPASLKERKSTWDRFDAWAQGPCCFWVKHFKKGLSFRRQSLQDIEGQRPWSLRSSPKSRTYS